MSNKKNVIKSVEKDLKKAANQAGRSIKKAGENVAGSVKSITKEINIEDAFASAMRIPGVRIDRTAFLRKELKGKYPEDTIELAIRKNPAYAGITRYDINKMANAAINYETSKVTLISAAAGIPGGIGMALSVPADVAQYFGFILRIVQKLAYLYGFEEFEFSENSFNDDAMNVIFVFVGVMFGVQNANTAIKMIADTASKKVARSLAQKALTKGTIYPIIKKVVISLGFNMNKQIFADTVAKAVPLAGSVASGGITFATFKPSALRLKRKLAELNISDPKFYKMSVEEQDAVINNDSIVDVEDFEVEDTTREE